MLDEPDKFKEYVLKSFEGGAQGISVFSFRGLKDDHLNMLSQVLKK